MGKHSPGPKHYGPSGRGPVRDLSWVWWVLALIVLTVAIYAVIG